MRQLGHYRTRRAPTNSGRVAPARRRGSTSVSWKTRSATRRSQHGPSTSQRTHRPSALDTWCASITRWASAGVGEDCVAYKAIVILAATLNAVPTIPAIGLVLVLSVDWFIGMARAAGNLVGNCVAAVVIAAWEGDLDRAQVHAVLDGETSVDALAD